MNRVEGIDAELPLGATHARHPWPAEVCTLSLVCIGH